jgi:hypothetical protein
MCCNDALKDDPLGKTNLSLNGTIERDEIVISWCKTRGIPVCLSPARGYGKTSCKASRTSMLNLNKKFNLF